MSWLDKLVGGQDPYRDGSHHERIYQNRYASNMASMLSLLEEFSIRHMRGWSKDLENMSPDGLLFSVVFRRDLTQRHRVKPVRMGARVLSGIHAQEDSKGGRPIRQRYTVPIQYQLTADFELVWKGTGWVGLTLRIVEDIDPNNMAEFAIGKHYHVPSQVWTDGWLGNQLNEFLAIRLGP